MHRFRIEPRQLPLQRLGRPQLRSQRRHWSNLCCASDEPADHRAFVLAYVDADRSDERPVATAHGSADLVSADHRAFVSIFLRPDWRTDNLDAFFRAYGEPNDLDADRRPEPRSVATAHGSADLVARLGADRRPEPAHSSADLVAADHRAFVGIFLRPDWRTDNLDAFFRANGEPNDLDADRRPEPRPVATAHGNDHRAFVGIFLCSDRKTDDLLSHPLSHRHGGCTR
mmetsp:Transcript_31230/g.100511  ORF Transcript_31230/g.100511 Transcript_31230/m.100511 type:complete len:228 (-) Transcript_31230:383-1066(-)